MPSLERREDLGRSLDADEPDGGPRSPAGQSEFDGRRAGSEVPLGAQLEADSRRRENGRSGRAGARRRVLREKGQSEQAEGRQKASVHGSWDPDFRA